MSTSVLLVGLASSYERRWQGWRLTSNRRWHAAARCTRSATVEALLTRSTSRLS